MTAITYTIETDGQSFGGKGETKIHRVTNGMSVPIIRIWSSRDDGPELPTLIRYSRMIVGALEADDEAMFAEVPVSGDVL